MCSTKIKQDLYGLMYALRRAKVDLSVSHDNSPTRERKGTKPSLET